MSEHYQVLYRKYRPQNWDEVIGQEMVKKILQGAIAQSKIPHAILLCGTKGIGKTTIARIFAKSIGVESVDIIEMDGASNRGIGEVRDLREAVNSLPFMSPYNVYIIDEVHMFTIPAWNAFLKVLEEPPSHVIFILATTDPDDIPETIHSRLLKCKLDTPVLEDLKKAVIHVSGKEGFILTPDEIDAIALCGNHAFRDTLGALERFSMAYDLRKEPEESELMDRSLFIGAAGISDVKNIIESIANFNPEKLYIILDRYQHNNTMLENLWIEVANTMSEIIKYRILKKKHEDPWIHVAVTNYVKINTQMVSLVLGLIIKIKRFPDYVFTFSVAESSNFFKK